MTDLWLLAIPLLLIVALAWDNRNHPSAWTDKEDRHYRSGRRHDR